MKDILTKLAVVNINPVGPNNGESDDLMGNVTNILNIVIGLLGIIAVVVIIIGGVTYMTSSGDSSKVKKAKDTILYGVIGLVVVALAFAIVNFVISGIIGGASGTE